jgi:PAS domain S-box-containing protein
MGFGRIMIVEDHRVIARDLQWELESLGYQVVGIESFGEAAVKQAEHLHPDLVIMDIILRGEMDGIEAAGTIGARFRIPVVYLTAHSDQSSLERIKASQPFGYLTKPFSSSELHGTIETALYKHRMEELLRASERRLEFALEGAELTMWDWNVTTGEVVRDSRFTRILGHIFGETETDVETWKGFIHPQDKPGVLKSLEKHLEGKSQSFEGEYRVRTSSGTWKWILDRGKVIERDHMGKPLRMVGTFMDVSDRKQAEEDLRRSEARSKALLSAIPDTMFLLSATGKILDFHNEESDWLLLHPDIVIGRRLDGVFPAEIAAMYGHHIELALNGGGAQIFEYRFDVPNRGPQDFEARMVSAGESEILAIVRNVTERKAAQEALRESEKQYRTLFESAVDGIFVHDLDGKFLDANSAGLSRLGYTREELLSMSPADLDTPEQAKLIPERIRQVLENGFGFFETAHRCRDGSILDLEFTARLIDYGGKQSILAIGRDIGERKRAEDLLKESEEKYRLVVDNASEGIAVVQDQMLKFVNARVREITGRSEEELTSRPFIEFIHPDDAPMVTTRYWNRVRGERSSESTRFRILDCGGEIKWVESSAVHIDWEGRPAILYFLEDVTEKRKVERELLRVQKLESIGVLAGGVAHDFNNILTAILGNISLAKYCANSPEKMLGRLNQAEQACSRARVLTRQLLTFSKGGEPVKAVLSLHDVIVESCLFGLRGSNVRCEFSLPEDLRNVEADEGQVSQVFNNLVINAGQAMPEGGTILVEGRNVEVRPDEGLPLAPGQYARITVSDTGRGIPEEELSRVFDPYFTTKPGGSGLGLAIAYSVLKNHQGLITVESQPGKGSAFHIYLPASDQQTDEEEVTLRNLETGSGSVLLMDDEPAVRELAGELIELLGYEVAVSEDGQQALQLYQEAIQSSRPFDVIILDLTVPGGMGGLEVIKTIRKTDQTVKAIVSSGYSNDPVMSDYKVFGFDGITAKPYTAAELGHALGKVLREEDQ